MKNTPTALYVYTHSIIMTIESNQLSIYLYLVIYGYIYSQEIHN